MWLKSVVLLVGLAAAATAAPGDVRIITQPSPGNEFVHIQTGRQLNPVLDDIKTTKREVGIEVHDEGKSGVIKHHADNEEIKIMVRKSESVETKVHEVHLDDSKEDNGKLKYHSSKASEVISLIDKKPAVPKKFEILSTTKSKVQKLNEEEAFDFVDTDAALSPAGTSQTSRVNIKKGPNGEDYEYEYVYYYYDEDEDPDNVKAKEAPTTKVPERQRGPQFIPPREEEPQTVSRGRATTEEPKRQREEAVRSRGEPDYGQEDSKPSSRNRYTTIERGRGKPDVTTTVEPVNNEVIPSRTPSRSRGRGNAAPAPVVEEVEDNLPANTRFPSRSRSTTTSAPATLPPQTDAPPQRTRNNIRRPSLVDSSSFRTHSSDIPEVDQDRYLHQYAQKENIPTNTRDSDFEEYRTEPAQRADPVYKPEPVNERVTPSTPEPSTSAPSSAEPDDDNKSDKAAFDLYAILQHQQEENNVVEPETTEVPETTTIITTTPTTTTTTTTTTPPPTTTTTTQEPTQRGRFRGGGTGSRNRFRAGSSSSQRGSASTTTTTEASAEGEAPKRGRFQPQHSRNPSQVSSYGRRGSSRSTSTTAAPQEETTRARSSFSNNRYRSRGRVQPSTETPEDSSQQSVSTEATTARSRVRLNVNGGPRPLRPGPRINIGGRGRLGVQTPAPVEVQETPVEASPQPHIEEESASPEPTTTPAVPSSTQDALTRLRNRPRLKVHAGPSRARPPVPGLRRKEPAAPEAPAEPAPTEPVPAEANPDEPATTTPQPETTRHSLIGRRRPGIRRLPGRPPAPPAPSS